MGYAHFTVTGNSVEKILCLENHKGRITGSFSHEEASLAHTIQRSGQASRISFRMKKVQRRSRSVATGGRGREAQIECEGEVAVERFRRRLETALFVAVREKAGQPPASAS